MEIEKEDIKQDITIGSVDNKNINYNSMKNSQKEDLSLTFLAIIIVIVLFISFIILNTLDKKDEIGLEKISDKNEIQLIDTEKLNNEKVDQDLALEKIVETEEAQFDSEKITSTIENYINQNLMNGVGTIIVKEKAIEEHGLYKIKIDSGSGQLLDIYMTKDEKLLFPQALNIQDTKEKRIGNEVIYPNNQNENSVENNKPKVELFVMSHCPYGTQIEKGILPVIDALGDKIDFEIKFCDYAMHGETEVNEQLNQYCIQKEENEKFINYLKCFLEAGESNNCLTKTNINTTKLNSCVSTTDTEFKITANFADKSTYKGSFPTFNIHKDENVKYKVQGSPALVINGEQVSSTRDPKSLLATICTYFENAPAECNIELPSVSAAPGFGFNREGNATEASCG